MSSRFGILTSNVLLEEVASNEMYKKNGQRTLLNGKIVRIERILLDDTYQLRCLEDDREHWETSKFNCPRKNCQLVPEKLWQYLAAVGSPIERVKVAMNKERCEKLLLITNDMVVGYTDDDNIHLGTVQYIGKVQSIGFCYGIKLHEKKSGSRCNGFISNKQYFNCLPGYGIFATIDRLVAHNVNNSTAVVDENIEKISPTAANINCASNNRLSINSTKTNISTQKLHTSIISPLQQDGFTDHVKELKSSTSCQPLSHEIQMESVNTNNDFDHNTVLQSDKLQFFNNKATKNYSVGSSNNESNIKLVNESSVNVPEVKNLGTHPDSGKSVRNRSLNPLSHMINSSKPNSKKRKEPTFKSYDSGVETGFRDDADTVEYIEPDPGVTNDITVGTLVQIGKDSDSAESHEMVCGVVRWLGIELPRIQRDNTVSQVNPATIIVGVELDDDDAPPDLEFEFTDGTFAGQRRFVCSTTNSESQHAVFVPLTMCRKDRRFMEENSGGACVSTTMGASGAAAGPGGNGRNVCNSKSRESTREAERDRRVREVKQRLIEAENGRPVIEGIIAPLLLKTEEDVKAVCTTFRGIQGHHNSCYLDATLFSMFTFTSVFDSLIYRPKRVNDIPEYEEVQRVLREEIVNPLRTNLFVNAKRVMTLRRYLDKLSSVSGLTSEEKDPEEFLNSLLAQILRAEPFLKLNSGQESYFYQLFVEKDDRLKLPTVQQLFEQSFHTSEIKLKEVPSCLIIQMPRFGKNYKMYPRIIPSQLLDITDIIENSPRACTICGNLAYFECVSCYNNAKNISSTSDIHDGGLESTAFCRQCVITFHQHAHRADHKPHPLDLPPDYKTFVEAGHESPQPPRLYMDLFAVVCIETSHYVAFVKCGNDPEASWCFFDSMADREGERDGFNIPAMVACPDVLKWLSDEQSVQSLHMDSSLDRHLPEHTRRLLCDAYICMYQKPDVMMYG